MKLKTLIFPLVRLTGIRLALLPLLAILGMAGSTMRAYAACGMAAGAKPGLAVKLPMLYAADEPMFYNPTIVGLWHVIYTNSANKQTFNDTFDTWHADGTEFESAFFPPAAGNVCSGVWKETNLHTVTLHHIGWIFNPATPTATATNYFTLDEVITVAPNGKTYSGTFTFEVWNLDGTPVPPSVVTGTIAATRITV